MAKKDLKTKRRLESFPPVVGPHSRILILGTMPGPESLRTQEYYAFKQNHFWKIMFTLLDSPELENYSEKIKLLTDRGIALWDVFKACHRENALDSNIRRAEYNGLPEKLVEYSRIKTIFLNGRTAQKVFEKQFSKTVKIPAYYLPSTSPANASMSFEKKLKAWSVILKALGD